MVFMSTPRSGGGCAEETVSWDLCGVKGLRGGPREPQLNKKAPPSITNATLWSETRKGRTNGVEATRHLGHRDSGKETCDDKTTSAGGRRTMIQGGCLVIVRCYQMDTSPMARFAHAPLGMQ